MCVIRTSEPKAHAYHSDSQAHEYPQPGNRKQMLHSHYLNNSDFVANVQSVWLPSAIGNLTVLKYIMTSFLEISLKGGYIFQLDTNKPIALNKFLPFPGKVTLQNVKIS